MTLSGTVNKTGILLVCAIATAGWTWHLFLQSRDFAEVAPLMMAALIGGLIFAMITIFKKEWSPVTAPSTRCSKAWFSAACRRCSTCAIRASPSRRWPDLRHALRAAARLSLRRDPRDAEVPPGRRRRYRRHHASFTCWRWCWDSSASASWRHQRLGIIGIGFSLIVVAVIAGLNLVLDFDFIERGVQYGAPKYMEWYGAFGIMVTLVWLYLEILRLLSKMQ
jgi:uncharacterized YccA/Bax inhibitor family protein